ncbi:MAG: nuclear transport factor 2 family protein [Candidatus Latescibacteria bacterium]|nr:nuclear transport factor 2 family protein [Candidatus Latescibacterota bacterium]
MTISRLGALGEAWDKGDLNALMSFMAEGCIYSASVGPEPGQTYVGREQVRRRFELMLEHDSGCESRGGRVVVSGSFGVAEWSYVSKGITGEELEVRGCDLFEFEGGLIKRKDAFRKTLA